MACNHDTMVESMHPRCDLNLDSESKAVEDRDAHRIASIENPSAEVGM